MIEQHLADPESEEGCCYLCQAMVLAKAVASVDFGGIPSWFSGGSLSNQALQAKAIGAGVQVHF